MKKLKKACKNQQGFTLFEMMIVLVIISTLLLIAVPNLSKNQEMANKKGCEATVELLRAQKIVYEIEKNQKLGELNDLLEEGYVDSITCPDGSLLSIDDLAFNIKEND
ncbi:competence type IV pilus major pilin ComGC [Evansella sp. AB-P1]|uniref:competence type IV pilus major pilin ComGC n=1 Tax=Evansella sp. AB-P1 TaxID=3037653 RepID=UPI00241D82B0|nr:competence type IV pilus major pilin ComGC [Evansella sp. AB-P1]MDG5788725.1 competence type IV pilus major pilin ComGC [Evansella sp. AB-P1]